MSLTLTPTRPPFPLDAPSSPQSPLSTHRRVEGGQWSRAQRFPPPQHSRTHSNPIYQRIESPGPAAAYNFPSLWAHAPSPVYRPDQFDSARSNSSPSSHFTFSGDGPNPLDLPSPSRDRTAWVIGFMKKDLAYWSDIAGHVGPASYNPSIDCSSTTPRSPRTLFDKNRRFSPLTQRYLSKEHNQANLCTASPGPQYSPKQCQLDLTSLFAPEYSFGGRGLTTDRSKYIHATVKGGYLYSARPSTSTGEINVSPAQYDIGGASKLVSPRSPRPVVSRAARFASSANGAPFVSKKHTAKSNLGMCSPGPMYNPPNESLSEKVKQRSKKARAPAGKWCP